jgi:hypothetical protein
MNRTINFSGNGATSNLILFSDEPRASDTTVSVQVVGAGTTVTLTYEVSNDGTNWIACPGVPVGNNATAAASTSTGAGILVFKIQTRYFRLRVSTAGAGTVTGVACFGIGDNI